MSNTTTRAKALSLTDQPPPRQASRRHRALLPAMMLAIVPPVFLAGAMTGHMIGPPSPERCEGARDVDACLIVTLD